MKRISAFILTLAMIVSMLPLCIYAEASEFVISSAPYGVIYTDAAGDAEDTRICAYYTVPKELHDLVAMSSEQRKSRYGFENVTAGLQLDFSTDDAESWHYSAEWDEVLHGGANYWDGYGLVGSETVGEATVFRLSYEETRALFGDDAIIRHEAGELSGEIYTFDFENHKLFLRSRWFVSFESESGEVKNVISGWSEAIEFDPEANSVDTSVFDSPVLPIIESVSRDYDEENGRNTFDVSVSFDLGFDSELLAARALGLPDFDFEFELRENGGNWQKCGYDYDFLSSTEGVKSVYLEGEKISDKSTVEIRVKYKNDGNSEKGVAPFESDWSKVFSFVGQNSSDSEGNMQTGAIDAKCRICGSRAVHPLGVCLYIWIGCGAVVAAVAVTVIIIAVRANKKKNKSSSDPSEL